MSNKYDDTSTLRLILELIAGFSGAILLVMGFAKGNIYMLVFGGFLVVTLKLVDIEFSVDYWGKKGEENEEKGR